MVIMREVSTVRHTFSTAQDIDLTSAGNQSASLILGGYDSARIKDVNAGISIKTPSDRNATLIAEVSSVSFSSSTSVESTTFNASFLARIDSAVPQL
jgi:hypothetical protein